MGKDTTIGHWEIAGVVSPETLPTFPEGFPEELIREYEQKTGHKVLCNKMCIRDRCTRTALPRSLQPWG